MSPTSYQAAPPRVRLQMLHYIYKNSIDKNDTKLVAGAGFEPTTFGL